MKYCTGLYTGAPNGFAEGAPRGPRREKEDAHAALGTSNRAGATSPENWEDKIDAKINIFSQLLKTSAESLQNIARERFETSIF